MSVSAEGKGERWYVDASQLSDKEFQSLLKEITPTGVLVRESFSNLRQIFRPRDELSITNPPRLKIPSW